jgi:predicted ATPase
VVVFVGGESGIGKSTLVGKFLDEVRDAGRAVVLSGRCFERESVPYKAFDRVVDELSRACSQWDALRHLHPRPARTHRRPRSRRHRHRRRIR